MYEVPKWVQSHILPGEVKRVVTVLARPVFCGLDLCMLSCLR